MSVLLASRTQTGTEAPPGTALDVWRIDLAVTDDVLAAAAALMTPAELARADRGTPVVRRRRMVLRAALRSVLGQALGLAPVDVPLCTSPTGRPVVDSPSSGWDVTCSRSADVGLVAVARGLRIGIDVERVRPWTDAVRREGWLTPTESAGLDQLPMAERPDAATRCWTQKEAVLKAVGTGLSVSPLLVSVSADRARAGRWYLSPVSVPNGFAATFACSAPLHPAGATLVPAVLDGIATADGTQP